MPLTKFQLQIARLLSENRSEDSYLAGGAALHFSPKSTRYSNDLDFFHDSVERVASAFLADEKILIEAGFTVQIEMKQPGFIRSLVIKKKDSTKIEWAHDSAWRFMPPVKNKDAGVQLHPIDLAINKLLALVGRDEARDFLDILYINKEILALGPLCWAAVGKDPGFTPYSLLEILKRRGKYRPEDFSRLILKETIDIIQIKSVWLETLSQAETFIKTQDPSQIGCLYYSSKEKKFVDPTYSTDTIPHFGSPGGVLPRMIS
jgi:hypothetical protein